MEMLPLALVIPVLLIAAASDLRHLRIPNNLSLVALALFACCIFFLPYQEVLLRLLFASLVFVIGFLLFAFRIVGGGDVKLFSALILFIPTQSLSQFGYVFSTSLLIGIIIMISLRNLPLDLGHNWLSLRTRNALPMGISIAMAGVFHLIFLTVFG